MSANPKWVRTRYCRECESWQEVENFYLLKNGDPRTRCKPCFRAAVTANRNAKIEKYRAYDRERNKEPGRQQDQGKLIERWRGEYPAAQAAHSEVAAAIKRGDLVRQPCKCGEVKTVAHHESYAHPLDVVWLCHPCHKERHKEMKEKGIKP